MNRTRNGASPRAALCQLQSHPEVYSQEAVNYFAAMGMEMFSAEYFELMKGKINEG